MSISPGQNNHSGLIARIKPESASLALGLSNAFKTEEAIETAFTAPELAAVLPYLSSNERVLLVVPRPDPSLATVLQHITDLADGSRAWHSITHLLSDQELSADIVTQQSLAYHALLGNAPASFIVSASMLQEKIPGQDAYREMIFSIGRGYRVSITETAHTLSKRGYIRHRTTLEPGSFRIRGEIVEIQPPLGDETIAITFSGNTVEKIIATRNQRTAWRESVTLPPLSFPATTSSWQALAATMLVARPVSVLLEGKKTVILGQVSSELAFSLPGKAAVAALERAFTPKTHTSFDSPLSYEQSFELIGSLLVGKPAVHADHGIGIFEGLQKRTLVGQEKEYLVLRYAQGDAVSVPIEFAHKVTPYVGDSHPAIHRLHGTAWKKARKAAQADAVAFAKELLAVAGKRAEATRSRYMISETIEKELDATFPHTLTADQVRTWQEVREDMQKDMPMDRLVVGDVGFGKTEIAYRAARHAIANGKQVAVLAPTTLLVQQHFDLFSARLPSAAGTVHLMSRFTTPAQRRASKEAVASGKANIVVGTQALLSPNVVWHNLGLVIIDEEQRFGVKQKEQLKKIRANLDVLSLSATPIPRTLSMALAGLRSLSLIASAPLGRRSVETFVGKITESRLQQAIGNELGRGGQAYIVAPKIRQLAAIKHQIHALFPEIRIAVAHGRLSDVDLSSIVHQFDAGEVRILISSSIVEHGLDLPGANTMIVFYAPHFGLSDLYQLRGRIGRRTQQGFAYFFYDQHELTPVQRERLTALTEASRLGSGWELARRDLEIRGAGNLLGAEQSGSVNEVGVQLYLDMVRQAASGEAAELERADVVLPFTALIPAAYIEDTDTRTAWYVRLTRARNVAELEKRVQTLAKEFGPLPAEAKNLLLVLRLQDAATRNSIQKLYTQRITPPDEEPYERIAIDTTNAPSVTQKLASMGNWRVRANSLTWDTDEISPMVIEKMIQALQN